MRLCALPFVIPLLALFAALFASPVAAVFADEAYQIDYHLPLLGLPQAHTTFFHRPSTNSRAALIYTLSDRNVLGAVNPKDGVLLWRQRLLDIGSNTTTQALLRAGDGADAVISVVEGNVQAWDAIDGRLVWESRRYGKVKALEVLADPAFENDVLIAYEVDGAKAVVERLAASTGVVKWTYEDARSVSEEIPPTASWLTIHQRSHTVRLGVCWRSHLLPIHTFQLTRKLQDTYHPTRPSFRWESRSSASSASGW